MEYSIVAPTYSGPHAQGTGVIDLASGIDLMTLELTTGSNAIDAGNSSSNLFLTEGDLNGDTRIQEVNQCQIDIGAFEFTGTNCAASRLVTKEAPTTNQEAQISLQVYPNPSSGNYIVEVDESSDGELKVYDLTSRLVLNQQFASTNKLEFDLTGYPNGIYHLMVVVNEKSITRKSSWTSRFLLA